jgi:pimeloyl-ACP methyl ester carboxylesterase
LVASRPDDGSDPNDPYAARIVEATETVELDDGRTLAYCEFGDPDGEPVVVFHGGVGSRGFGLLFEDAAIEVGVRIVSPDRPGYGRSDPQPNRGLLDWPDDVATLADELGLERFAVLGVSGGGPYAAACAYRLPDRLTTAVLVSSIGPPDAPRTRGLVVLAWLARWVPWIAGIPIERTLTRARTDPDAAVEARARGKAEPEAAMHRGDAGRRLNAQTAEAGRQGHRHAVDEIAIVGRPWGFDLAEIRTPVGIWHGRLDRTVPVGAAEYLADVVPDARVNYPTLLRSV